MPYIASVIIVSYNNYETTTGPCLDSLLTHEGHNDLEIIVVDNHSKDKTPERLTALASQHDNLKIILNDSNRGFAGGNNDGVKQASADIVILLNSDTVVPRMALIKLASLLKEHEGWAMLGPVTNQAGNEQKIPVEGKDVQSILEEGSNWAQHSNGDCFESLRLDFCCVAVRKLVYMEVGGLDESFGLGYYEDTDFSMRVAAKGYPMLFTETVFVFHKGSESFSAAGRQRAAKLMKKNKRLLKQKHKGEVRLLHIRDCNLAVMKAYKQALHARHANREIRENILYRFHARRDFAETLYPNNPLKKIKYWLALRRLDPV